MTSDQSSDQLPETAQGTPREPDKTRSAARATSAESNQTRRQTPAQTPAPTLTQDTTAPRRCDLPLDDRERAIVSQLSRHNPYHGMSRIATLRALPRNRKWTYFRQALLARVLAVIAAVVVAVMLAVHLLTPVASPRLYVAVIDGALDTQDGTSLQTATARALNLPEGRDGGVRIDTYFNLDTDGLDKLQTMLSSGDIDVIIANSKDFKQLAGYGYCVPLGSALDGTQQHQLAASYVSLNGFSDAHDDDMDYNGSGKGSKQPFGLKLSGFANWTTWQSASADALVGFAQDSRNKTTAQQFIDYLRDAKDV